MDNERIKNETIRVNYSPRGMSTPTVVMSKKWKVIKAAIDEFIGTTDAWNYYDSIFIDFTKDGRRTVKCVHKHENCEEVNLGPGISYRCVDCGHYHQHST